MIRAKLKLDSLTDVERDLWLLVNQKFESLAELSTATGIRERNLNSWRRGDHKLPLREAVKIARAVNTDVHLTVRLPWRDMQ